MTISTCRYPLGEVETVSTDTYFGWSLHLNAAKPLSLPDLSSVETRNCIASDDVQQVSLVRPVNLVRVISYNHDSIMLTGARHDIIISSILFTLKNSYVP